MLDSSPIVKGRRRRPPEARKARNKHKWKGQLHRLEGFDEDVKARSAQGKQSDGIAPTESQVTALYLSSLLRRQPDICRLQNTHAVPRMASKALEGVCYALQI